MLHGHGDDIHDYPDIRINFSSNIHNSFSHKQLFRYLSERFSNVLSYPEPTPVGLEQEIAQLLGMNGDDVCVTNGATESIYLAAQAFRGSHSAILIPTFSEYEDACLLHGHKVTHIRSLAQIPEQADMVWLCCPNNPTGTVLDKSELLEAINRHSETLFFLDASYAIYTQKQLISPTESLALPNVLMLHSMTKEFAIPGLRIGFLTACPSLIQSINSQRMPWSVNQVAIDAAHYLLNHRDEFRLDIAAIIEERERLRQALNNIEGIEAYSSDTHILLCRVQHATAAELKEHLALNHGILIRDASNFAGLDTHHFRIAVQTPAENDELCRALAFKPLNL